MRLSALLTFSLLLSTLTACSGIDIEPSNVEQFAAGNYQYYKWRTEPLPQNVRSSDPLYALDPTIRETVDASLQAKGYQLDETRGQFSVGYLYALGMRDGAVSGQASNISYYPTTTANRQVDGASVDNAVALGGVKETNNILLQFNDVASNKEVWHVTMTKIVEDSNTAISASASDKLRKYVPQALETLPQASH
jgi:hypothetical protein